MISAHHCEPPLPQPSFFPVISSLSETPTMFLCASFTIPAPTLFACVSVFKK